MAFLHSHRNGFPGGWHTDAPGLDNVIAIKTLNLDFVRRNGYVNMRCQWEPGCPDWVQPLRSADSEDPENLERRMPEGWRALFGEDSEVPNVIATPCCAQFAVSREQVLKRSLEEYEWYHQWLMATEMSDGLSGRIFEYLWHVIFGMNPVYCPDVAQCYRDVYNREYNSTEWELERQQLIDEWNSTQRVV
ncbi:hypothetical protein PRZ48_002535 [Zasmidium cellare]|uniref:Uncharacterized protein n=1 Tax=Zasmidium cellare TaxID=395010 RepID=A0ABR0F6I2_ZASCE|nr:hypothetical protein PRZ48_002535 [Zasmidium cellare]